MILLGYFMVIGSEYSHNNKNFIFCHLLHLLRFDKFNNPGNSQILVPLSFCPPGLFCCVVLEGIGKP